MKKFNIFEKELKEKKRESFLGPRHVFLKKF